MKIIDTHTHLYFSVFDKHREEIIKRNQKSGVVHEIQIGCDELSSIVALELAKKYDHMYCTLGLHPTDVQNIGKFTKEHRYLGYENYELKAHNQEELIQFFEELFEKNSEYIVGFGETGFDLFHKNSEEVLELQKKAFIAHIYLAEKFQRPLIIHSRSARKETLDFLKEHHTQLQNIKGVFHCFCEDIKTAKIVTEKYGFMIGVGGVATYKNAENVRDVIREIPLEFLLTETDAPFLVPNNFRKKGFKINESTFLIEVVELIAKLKNMDTK